MLRVSGLSKAFAGRSLFSDVSFSISAGDRVGLVGPNGSGKTTLLEIIVGREQPDVGSVWLDPNVRPGYLPQGAAPLADRSIADAVAASVPGLSEARREVAALAERMAVAPPGELDAVMTAYADAAERLEALGGYELDIRLPEMLARLGMADVSPDRPVGSLSGGQQTRVALAALLWSRPGLLVLDEPTNHLDLEALEWLEGYIRDHQGAVLIVSHDRAFLDATVSRILELDPESGRVREYAGNYSDYAAAKERELQAQWARYQDQEEEVARAKAEISRMKSHARSVERSTTDFVIRKIAKGVARRAKARERRLERYLGSPDRVEKPTQRWRMRVELGQGGHGGRRVAQLDGLGHRYGDRWVFRRVSAELMHGDRVALVGPNGSGKSTLLRILAGELTPSTGRLRLGEGVRVGYMPQQQVPLDSMSHQHASPDDALPRRAFQGGAPRQQTSLDWSETPLSLVRASAELDETEARRFLHQYLFTGDGPLTLVGSLSYGERARLLLALLVIRGADLLLLDEPLNYLDIPSRERFEEALASFPGTVVVAVHDRAFIDRYATALWSLERQHDAFVLRHR